MNEGPAGRPRPRPPSALARGTAPRLEAPGRLCPCSGVARLGPDGWSTPRPSPSPLKTAAVFSLPVTMMTRSARPVPTAASWSKGPRRARPANVPGGPKPCSQPRLEVVHDRWWPLCPTGSLHRARATGIQTPHRFPATRTSDWPLSGTSWWRRQRAVLRETGLRTGRGEVTGYGRCSSVNCEDGTGSKPDKTATATWQRAAPKPVLVGGDR